MKIVVFVTVLSGCLSLGLTSREQTRRPVEYVNPLIGTAPMEDKQYLGNNPAPGEELYYGCVNPGAMVPRTAGHLCVGPVSGYDGERYHVRGSGYRFTDETLMGFTILNGEYHDDNKLLFIPTIGQVRTIPGTRANPFAGYRSAKDTSREKASPGYYTVFLTTYGIKVELTATRHCGFQRYIFPSSQEANVLIDLANSQPFATNASVHMPDKRTIAGFQDCGTDTVYHLVGNSRIYFYAVFSKDFALAGTWKNDAVSPGSLSASGMPLGAYATFSTAAGEEILVKIGTSVISEEDAQKNLAAEIPGMDFNTVRGQAETAWSKILDHTIVEGGSEADRVNFYTAVYRKNGYSWDGHPRSGGEKPGKKSVFRGNWGGGYWGPGAVSRVVGAYKKGLNQYDLSAAYEKLRNDAMNGGDAAGTAYRKYGYIPPDAGVNDYVNRSIGLSYDDYALSELARIVGRESDHDLFLARSKNYKKLFDPSTGFFTPRRADGSWILPLNPFDFHAEDIYREGNAWNYLWFNAGDIPGLMALLGGRKVFIDRLDTFFSKPFPDGATPLRDCTGLIGLYCHGNEQYRHIPYYYNYARQPWKTQRVIRKIQKELYRAVPAGLCGMDDYGTMEGWYATSVLGYGEVDAASGFYEIGSPLFPTATIQLEGTHQGVFTIRAHNVSDINQYIQSAILNGKPLVVPRFRQQDMIPGGSLVFEMGPSPNYNWGTGVDQPNAPVDYVNPLLGTATLWDSTDLGFVPSHRPWGAEVFPGSSLPNAMVQPSPVTQFRSGSGYQYEDTVVYGFIHTSKGHWNLCNIPLMPVTGAITADDYRSAFSHKNESAHPGYYQVYLARYGINAELTSTLRCAFHKYTFQPGQPKELVANLSIANERIRSWNITQEGPDVLTGFQQGGEKMYFYAVTNHLIDKIDSLKKDTKIVPVVHFADAAKPLEIQIGFSFVSIKNAKENLEKEMLGKSFDQVRQEASDTWSALLSKIIVTGGTERQKGLFYSCLYRSFLWPALRSDINGDFTDLGGKVVNKGFNYYTEPSLWDDYRNKLILLGLFSPKVTNDVIQSLIDKGKVRGFMPTFFHGDHASVFITGSFLRGLTGYDVKTAYALMLKNATVEGTRKYVDEYNTRGYISELEVEKPVTKTVTKAAVTKTLEYAYDDYAVALLARELHDTVSYRMLMKRTGNYKNVFDPSTRFMRGRLANGDWVKNFDPEYPYYEYMYREANAWQSSFFAPHDTKGLIALYGGNNSLEKKLDSLFTIPWKGYEADNLTGFIGQYCQGNQPDHSYPFLYTFIGRQEKSQFYLDSIMNHYYDMGKDKLAYAGMDDAGEMSSWFVFSAMGFYPFSPADPQYVISVPLFDRVECKLANNKIFTILKKNTGKKITGINYGGQKIGDYFIRDKDLKTGQQLVITTR